MSSRYSWHHYELASTWGKACLAETHSSALESYQAGSPLHLAGAGSPLCSGEPGINMDQISGSRPAPHSLAESLSRAHVRRKADDCSKVKLEIQTTHTLKRNQILFWSSREAQELGRVLPIGIFQITFG